MRIEQTFSNPTWRNTILNDNPIWSMSPEAKWQEAIIRTDSGLEIETTTATDIASFIEAHPFPTGTTLKLIKKYVGPGPLPIIPENKEVLIATYKICEI